MNDLKNKSILITGASTGIGAAAARAFGVAGARVAVHYRRNLAEAETVVRDIESTGSQAFVVQADVTDTASVDRMVETVYSGFGRIDVLVNNAGGFVRRAPIVDADDDYIDAVFQLNARSVVAVSRCVIPLMQAGGSIINVTTQAARTGGGPGAGLYAACKGFVSTITRTMAKELVNNGIRVNAVAPGVIETPFHDGHSSPAMLKNFGCPESHVEGCES